ncbi:MAG: DUF98 domain-containing protein [Deltaproteobacteria bacterium]|nr:DUF98 domain-containing protein [Deltaproteobacteria bacterium]
MHSDAADRLTSGLRPHQKMLFTSGGSLTLDLELLLEEDVKVDVVRRRETDLDIEIAAYLHAAPGAQVSERVVWLKTGHGNIVYALTVFLLERTDPAILASLDRYFDEPLGKVLNHRRIVFTKTRMEAGVVVCAEAASVLNLPDDSPFVARRYVLADSGASVSQADTIQAAVIEVFSPAIIPVVARPDA